MIRCANQTGLVSLQPQYDRGIYSVSVGLAVAASLRLCPGQAQRSPTTRKRTLSGFLLLALIATLASGCATTMPAPPGFLQSKNASWNQWMDAVIDVDMTEVRIAHLPLTDAFLGMSIVIAKADASLRWLPVTLHARQVTRRQALWLISKRYGLKMTVESIAGQPPYLGITKD